MIWAIPIFEPKCANFAEHSVFLKKNFNELPNWEYFTVLCWKDSRQEHKMHPFFHSSPFFPFFSGQLFLCCLLEGGVWRMGPFLPNCRFEGFFSLVHAGLKIHLFDKALYFYEIKLHVTFRYVIGTEVKLCLNLLHFQYSSPFQHKGLQ